MNENLDDVKRAHLNRNPNIKTFRVKANKDFDINQATEISDFKQWMSDAMGFKLIDFAIQNDLVVFTVQKHTMPNRTTEEVMQDWNSQD
jgi:hypothetical protein